MFKVTALFFMMSVCGLCPEPLLAQTSSTASKQLPAALLAPVSQDFNGLWKQFLGTGFRINRASLELSTIHNRSIWSDNLLVSNSLSQFHARTFMTMTVAGIPIKGEYLRRESKPDFADFTPKNWYQFSLDAEQYKSRLKAMATKLGPEALTKSGNALQSLKTEFSQKLQAEAQSQNKKNRFLFDSIAGSADLTELQSKSPAELEKRLFGQGLDALLEQTKSKLYSIEQASVDQQKKDSQVLVLKEKIQELEEKLAFVKKVHALIQLQKSAGVLDQMKDLEARSLTEFQSLLEDPQAIAGRLSEKYNLGGLARIVMMISQFRMGGQALPTENTTIPFLNNGVSFELNTGDKLLAFSAGKLLPVFSNLSVPNSISPQPEPPDRTSFLMIHYRKGKKSSNHKGVRLSSFRSKGGTDNQLQPSTFSKRNSVLMDLYSRERIVADNWLILSVSKSLVTGGNPKQGLFNLNNMLFKLGADGKIEKHGITYQSYFHKTFGAYASPTENYLGTDGYEAGVYIRVKPAKTKLAATFRGKIRNFKMSGPAVSLWNNTSYRTSFMYKLKKGQAVQLHFLVHDGYRKYVLNNAGTIIRQQSKAVTTDINTVNKRLFGLYNTSYLSFGIQKDEFPLMQNTSHQNGQSIAFNALFNQSFLMGENILQCNFYYTRVSQGYDNLLYNTRFDADGGSSFKLGKNISGGASLVYGFLKGAYSNYGLRPYVTATILKSMTVDVNADVRKNLKVHNPLFEKFMNLSCNIKYTLK